jgi:hypothetical protein
MSEIIIIEVEKTHSWELGDFCRDQFGIYIVAKDDGKLFTTRLQDGICSWGIPDGAVWLPPKTEVKIIIS